MTQEARCRENTFNTHYAMVYKQRPWFYSYALARGLGKLAGQTGQGQEVIQRN
jgi:hypothetical protein